MSAYSRNLSIIVGLVLSLLPDTSVSCADSDRQTVTVDDVVRAWEARAKRVKTLQFKWTERRVLRRGEVLAGAEGGFNPENPRGLVVPEIPKIFNKSLSLEVDGDKIRYEKLDLILSVDHRLVPQQSVWVFASEAYRVLHYPGGSPYPDGTIIQERHISNPPFNDPNIVPLLMTYRPFHPMFSTFRNFRKRFRVIAGKHVVEGRDCILLKDQPWSPSQFSVSLYVDPARDFLVLRKVHEAKGSISSDLTFLEYAQLDDDWVPVRWLTTFASSATPARKNAPRVTEFALGEAIDAIKFELDFPPGTMVRESGRPTLYIVKEGGQLRTIIPEEGRVATYDEFLQSETGTLANGIDTTDDPAARRNELAKIRGIQVSGLRGWGVWNCLVTRDDGVEVRIELARQYRPPSDVEVVVTEESSNQMLFGKERDEAVARDELAAHLRRNIESVDQIFQLSETQKQKLSTAGREDIQRFFKQAVELRSKIRKPFYEKTARAGTLDDTVNELLRETRARRHFVDSGKFESESLFVKTLKSTLTAEQAAAYEAAHSQVEPSEKPSSRIDRH